MSSIKVNTCITKDAMATKKKLGHLERQVMSCARVQLNDKSYTKLVDYSNQRLEVGQIWVARGFYDGTQEVRVILDLIDGMVYSLSIMGDRFAHHSSHTDIFCGNYARYAKLLVSKEKKDV